MNRSLKYIITKVLGGICLFAVMRAWNTGESLLPIPTWLLAGPVVWLLTMNTENGKEDDELEN